MTAALAGAVIVAFVLSVDAWTPMAMASLPLLVISAIWIAGGAATAVLGLFRPSRPQGSALLRALRPGRRPSSSRSAARTPAQRPPTSRACAPAWTGRASATARASSSCPTRPATPRSPPRRPRSGRWSDAGVLTYRRRAQNIGRKPGNIADWLARRGDDHDYMLVLDADSRMSADRIRRLIARMDARPRLGLLQAAIALTPGRTRFGRHQRMAAQLLGPTFVRGFAAWTGRQQQLLGT
jgi:membrane glycosyltransferase